MSNLRKVLIGIRDSKLSIAQTNFFLKEANKINEIKNSFSFEIKTIKTKGDIHNNHRLDQLGGKGLFVKEIEEQILSGDIDIGIHSLKDLPAVEISPSLEIGCWLKRYDARDALISNNGQGIGELEPNSVIGTSSIRRRSQILNFRKDLKIKLLRGNVDTRLQKLKDNEYDAIILSLAGLQRINAEHLVTEVLSFDYFLPASCQGAVSLQVKKNNNLDLIFSKLNHSETQIACTAEREILKTINANCNSPVSVYAHTNKEEINIDCILYNHEGDMIFKTKKTNFKKDFMKTSHAIGNEIIRVVGQNTINELDELKNDFDYSPI